MGMRTPITLSWEGKPYKVLVTMEVVDRIEDDLNLYKLVTQTATGDIRFSKIAKLISLLLIEGGCKVTQQDVWEGMFAQGGITATDLAPLMGEIFEAVYPTPKKKEGTPKLKAKVKNLRTASGSKATSSRSASSA